MMKFATISVETYSGYKVNERPVSFEFQGRSYRVVDICDRWYEGHDGPVPLDYFKVLADDRQHYILRYNGLFDGWALLIQKEK